MVIIGLDQIVNGVGNFQETDKILREAKNLRTKSLELMPLSRGWDTELAENEFRSGASAVEALAFAERLLDTSGVDLVIIHGQDHLASQYSSQERKEGMRILKEKVSPMEAYSSLTETYLKNKEIKVSTYLEICRELFANYRRTWEKVHHTSLEISENWEKFITTYLRGVDCANPNIDFQGRLLVTNEKSARELRIPSNAQLKVRSVVFKGIGTDSVRDLPEIAKFTHLKEGYKELEKKAELEFKTEFLSGNALVDVYTCFPVVPLAFLLETGLTDLAGLAEFLKRFEITTFGGLNLARAPWNLTGLRSIIEMNKRLTGSARPRYGLVHANGSIGQAQGLVLLERE